MAQLPIDFLLRGGSGEKFLPIASLDSVYDGNRTLREILAETFLSKLDRNIDGENSHLFNDSLVTGIDGQTGVAKIVFPSNATTDEAFIVHIFGVNAGEEFTITFGGQCVGGFWKKTSSFCSNSMGISGTIKAGFYGGKKVLLIGDNTTYWEKATIFVDSTIATGKETNWNQPVSFEIIENDSPIEGKVDVPINNSFSVENANTVNGYKVNDAVNGTNQDSDNALWTAYRIVQEIKKGGNGISVVDGIQTEGTNTYKVTIADFEGYKDKQLFGIIFDRTNTGTSSISINDLPNKTIYKFINGNLRLLETNDLFGGGCYLLVFKDDKFVLVDESNRKEIFYSNLNAETAPLDGTFSKAFNTTLTSRMGDAVYPISKTSLIFQNSTKKNLETLLSEIDNQIAIIKEELEKKIAKPEIANDGYLVAFGANKIVKDSGIRISDVVKKEPGKGLSTNDYTNEEKQTVADFRAMKNTIVVDSDLVPINEKIDGKISKVAQANEYDIPVLNRNGELIDSNTKIEDTMSFIFTATVAPTAWREATEKVFSATISNEKIGKNHMIIASPVDTMAVIKMGENGLLGFDTSNDGGNCSLNFYGYKPTVPVQMQFTAVPSYESLKLKVQLD